MPPLEGLLVLDLTRYLPGAVATQSLADLGAEVIKIERPTEGDPARDLPSSPWMFACTNRGKKSIAVDLKKPEGNRVLRVLASRADVLVESFRPGVMARLGLDYPTLAKLNKQLIYVSLSGFGQSGPDAGMAAHDINYLAVSGMLALLSSPRGVPTIPEVQLSDLVGGSAQALIGILVALRARDRTGNGHCLDISIVHGTGSLLSMPIAALRAGGRAQLRGQELLSGGYACYNLYQAADGAWIAVGALEPIFWTNLCNELGCPELIDYQFSPGAQQSRLKARIGERFASRPQSDWASFFAGKDCCVTPVLSVEEAVSRYHFEDPGFIPRDCGPSDAREAKAPPQVGEHSMSVLERFGFSVDDLNHLKRDGVIQ